MLDTNMDKMAKAKNILNTVSLSEAPFHDANTGLTYQNPYSKEGTKQLNKQFGVKKASKRLEAAQNKYRQTIAKSSGFTDALNKIIERKQPLNQELAKAGTDFASVENPFVRADLMDRAENAIRGGRNNLLGQGVEALNSLAAAKQYGIGTLENTLSRKLGDRDQARQFAGTQYLNEVNFSREATQREKDRAFEADLQNRQREEDRQFQFALLAKQREEAMKQYQDQQAYDKSQGIGNFAPRSSGGGGGSSTNMQFKELADGTVGYFNPDTGAFTPTAFVNVPTTPDYQVTKDSEGNLLRVDPNTGDVAPITLPGNEEEGSGFFSNLWQSLMGKGN